jgi:hypothetical protein
MSNDLNAIQPEDIVLESLPDEVAASMETRDRWMASLQYASGGLEFLIADLQGWGPGKTVRVAFLGGSESLYREIEEVTRTITENANVVLDFKNADGTYRTWSEADRTYAAEIRVSFDQTGNFSLVGTDSTNPNIGLPQHLVGGAPHQRSLNLGGFNVQKPPRWEGTVRHEFLHALAFSHEHQNMRGPCEAAFRWEDDPGYQLTRDHRGAYVVDGNNRRPGIYTYLSGFPNGWSKQKVDHNLRIPSDSRSLVAGAFDPASVMLYRFPPLFYRTQPSPCSPTGDGVALSEGDIRGLNLLYPRTTEAVNAAAERRKELIDVIDPQTGKAEAGLEATSNRALSTFAAHASQRLRESLRERNG